MKDMNNVNTIKYNAKEIGYCLGDMKALKSAEDRKAILDDIQDYAEEILESVREMREDNDNWVVPA